MNYNIFGYKFHSTSAWVMVSVIALLISIVVLVGTGATWVMNFWLEYFGHPADLAIWMGMVVVGLFAWIGIPIGRIVIVACVLTFIFGEIINKVS